MSRTGTLAKVGAGLAAAGVGAALGLAAERLTANRAVADEDGSPLSGLTPYGALRGRPRTVRARDGTKLHVEIDDGPESGESPSVPTVPADQPTVLFTHGFALNLDAWHFQRVALRGHYRLVFWDQRGHGRSAVGPAGSSTIETLGGDLARVIESVAPTGPLVLVGHSMGGMTIMALAGQQPGLVQERVIAVGFIGTSAGGLADVPWTQNPLLSRVVHGFAPGVVSVLAKRPALVSRTRRLGSDLEQILVRRYSFASPVPASLVRFAADMIAATPIEVVADFLPTFDLHDERAALGALQSAEVLVLGGAQDAMTPTEHSDELAILLPHAEHLVVQDAGHLVMLEHPDVVDRALFALIERGLARSAANRASRGGRRRTVVGLAGARRRRRHPDPT
jgi:pimeloyl-ACP methyl ester carboxylesterase